MKKLSRFSSRPFDPSPSMTRTGTFSRTSTATWRTLSASRPSLGSSPRPGVRSRAEMCAKCASPGLRTGAKRRSKLAVIVDPGAIFKGVGGLKSTSSISRPVSSSWMTTATSCSRSL